MTAAECGDSGHPTACMCGEEVVSNSTFTLAKLICVNMSRSVDLELTGPQIAALTLPNEEPSREGSRRMLTAIGFAVGAGWLVKIGDGVKDARYRLGRCMVDA